MEPLRAGRLRVGLFGRFDPLTQLVYGDHATSTDGPTGVHQDVHQNGEQHGEQHGGAAFYSSQVALSLRYALSATSELWLSLPMRAQTVRVDVSDEHHRNETLQGLADITLGAKHYPISTRRWLVGGSLGVTIPTGQRNPISRLSFVDHDLAKSTGITVPEHNHQQLGSGVFSPIAALQVVARLPRAWLLFGSAQGRLPLYSAVGGYRTAPSGSLRLGVAYVTQEPRLLLSFAMTSVWAGRDQLSGPDVVGTKGTLSGTLGVPNTGRVQIALAPSVTWWISGKLSVTAQVRIPVYTRIYEGADGIDVQLVERYGVRLGVAYDLEMP